MKHRNIMLFITAYLLFVSAACDLKNGITPTTESDNPGIDKPTKSFQHISSPATQPKDELNIPPHQVNIPIWIGDGNIEPKEIELFVGQELYLDIYNIGIKSHSFTIGRNVIWKDGRPAGFEIDFLGEDIATGSFLIEGGGILLPFFEDEADLRKEAEQEGFLEGQLADYDKTMLILPQPPWDFLWRRTKVGVDFSTGSDMSIRELIITSNMLGEWEYACFSGNGQHYLDGERGKLVVKKP
ncbi:MAG: hypothetical protein J7L73_08625 [Anaerolineales bacterium]|nr:hypothetical protein [Anaerolineales bacterium]